MLNLLLSVAFMLLVGGVSSTALAHGDDIPSFINLVANVTQQGSVLLLPGEPMWSESAYYMYMAPDAVPFRIQVSPLAGEVDLFVTDYTNPNPSYNSYNYTSVTSFSEIIDITPNCNGNSSCPFYIAVSAERQGINTFTILIEPPSAFVPLSFGLPVNGINEANAANYYSITFTPSAGNSGPITISVVAGNGDPNLYVTLNDFSGNLPGPTNFQYSTATSGLDLLVIPYFDPLFLDYCQLGKPCSMDIAVHSLTSAEYTIVISAPGYSTIIENTHVTGGFVNQGQFAYFNYTPSDNSSIMFSVTSLTGDADVYVALAPLYPTLTNYLWNSSSMMDELVMIDSTDPNFAPPPATYLIGVYGRLTNSTFTITANQQTAGNVTRLYDGVPQTGGAAQYTTANYIFNMSTSYPVPAPGLDIVAEPLSGDLDLYVSNITQVVNGVVVPVWPTVTCLLPGTSDCLIWGIDPATYTWSSRNQGTVDVVVIPPSQVTWGGAYFISVFSTTRNTSPGQFSGTKFQITASTGASNSLIPIGGSVPGIVGPSDVKYYMVQVTQAFSDIVIACEILSSGSLNLYGSESPQPNNGTSTWNTTSHGIQPDRLLFIPYANLSSTCQSAIFNGRGCTLYISVVGYSLMPANMEASYVISADYSGNPLFPLYLGNEPLPVVVPANTNQYIYSFLLEPVNSMIYVVATNLVGSVTLYMNLGTNNHTFYTPGSSDIPDLTAYDQGGFETLIMIPPPNPTPSRALKLGISRNGLTGEVALATDAVNAEASVDLGAHIIEERADGSVVIGVPVSSIPSEALHSYNPSLSVKDIAEQHIMALRRSAETGHPLATIEAGTVGYDADGVEIPGQFPYCNFCSVYITATAEIDSMITINLHSSADLVPLVDEVPMQGFAYASQYTYYSFQASNPNGNINLHITQLSGAVDVYVGVQSAVNPSALPSAFQYTWMIRPWTGQSSLNISSTDPNFCVPEDGSSSGVPCTFVFAVYARQNQTASFTIEVSGEPIPLVDLFDGQPVSGSVAEGSVVYYNFFSNVPSTIAQEFVLWWTDVQGGLSVYMTNEFNPGVSPLSWLPGPNSQASCQWSSEGGTRIFVTTEDPCYESTMTRYTIAVYGNSSIPDTITTYMLTATLQGDPTVLPYGEPFTDIFLPSNANVNFTFDVTNFNVDFIVSATPVFGQVIMLVQHSNHSTPNIALPSCSRACDTCQVVCQNYLYMADMTKGAAPIIYVNASAPCTPVTVAGEPPIIVSPSCNASMPLHVGTYYVTLFGLNDYNDVSLVVSQAGDSVQLSDSYPIDLQTSSVTLCPHDNVTGICTGAPSNFIPNVQQAVFSSRVPFANRNLDQYVIMDRVCGAGTGTQCGSPMIVFVTACPDAKCIPDDFQPSSLHYDDVFLLGNVQSSYPLNFTNCQVPGNPLGQDCLFFFAAYPACVFSPNAVPGQNCGSQIVRAVLSTDTGATLIPNDCFANNQVCSMGVTTVAAGVTKRYEVLAPDSMTPPTVELLNSFSGGLRTNKKASSAEAFAAVMPTKPAFHARPGFVSTMATSSTVAGTATTLYAAHQQMMKEKAPLKSVPLTFQAEICSGTLAMYVCQAFSGGCNPFNLPGPGNYDQIINPTGGFATLTQSYPDNLVYLGVRPVAQAGYNNPYFKLQVYSPTAPVLSATSPLRIVRSPDALSMSVTFDPATLSAPANPANSNVAVGASYSVFVFVHGLTGQSRLDTSCGVESAFFQSQQGSVLTAFNVSGPTVQFTQLNDETTYDVAVVAHCAGACANYGMDQFVAYTPVSVPPHGPQPPPGPSNKKKGMHPAGAFFLSVFIIGIVGLGAFVGYKRYKTGSDPVTEWFKRISGNMPSFGGFTASTGSKYAPTASSDIAFYTSGADDASLLAGEDASYTAL